MDIITPLDLPFGFSSDLENFVVDPVVITDNDGNPVSTFYYNSDYMFHITFRETAALQFAYFHDDVTDTDYMTYQLPPQLKVRQTTVDNSPYPIFGESLIPSDPKPTIGYYSIDIDGLIQVHFDDVDKYGNPALVFDEELQEDVLVNFIDYYTDAVFTLDISAQFSFVGSEQEIDFGNDVIITVTVENPLAGTLDISKSSTVSVITDKTVNYSITITAQNGPVHDISLSDFEQEGANGFLQKAVFAEMLVSIDGGSPYTPPEFTALQGQLFGSGFGLSFPSVTLDLGEQIVITFTLDVTDLIDEWLLAHPSTAGAYHFDLWLYNRALAQGLDEYGTPTPRVTADNNTHLQRKFLSKVGTQDLDYDYTVKWSNWSVGDGVTPLNNSEITDTLTGLLFGGNNTLPNDENGVSLTFVDAAGNAVALWYLPVAAGAGGFSFTVSDAAEMVVTGMRPDGIYVQAKGAHASESLPYGLVTQVMIETPFWTTVADESDFDESDTNRYFNTISIEIDEDEPSYTVDVFVNRPGGTPLITKTAVFGGASDEIEYVEWTISHYVPRAAYGHPVTFMDDLLMYIYNYDGANPRRLGVQNVPENFVLKVGDTELVQNVDYTLIDSAHTNGYWQAAGLTTQWFLFFIGDTTGISWSDLKGNSIWPYQDDTWITIKYQTPLTAIVGEGSNEISLKDAFQWAKGDFFSHVQNWIYGYNAIQDVDNVATIRWGVRKWGVVSGNTITYQVEIRTEHFDLRDILTDVFDPLLEYVPFSMRIWKKDAPSTYYGPYEMIAGTFTDMLDASISVNTMSFDFLNMYRVNWEPDGAKYYPDPSLLSDVPPAVESYIMEYKMQLKEDAPLGRHTLENWVKVNGFTGSSTDDIGTKVVDKTMSASSNIASVSILINPDEKVLDGVAGKYTVTDILSDTLAIYLSTIEVEAWEGGAWVLHPLVSSTSGELWTYTTSGANQISFVVPDSTMLKVTYKALIKGVAGDTVTIGNEVTVAGEYYDFVEEVFYITDTSGSCTGTRTTVTVLKNDSSDPDIFLPGAIFALYIGIAYPGWETTKVPADIDRVITIGSMEFYYLTSGTTNDLGRFVFNHPWLTPTHMAIYALLELRAPVGYELPLEPISLFSYTVPTDAQKEALGPLGDDVQQISDVISVLDTRQEDLTAIIHGVKIVIGKNAPAELFTFWLTQVADDSGTPIPDPYTDKTTTLGSGSFGFSLSNLTTGNTYYYKITEDTNLVDTGWTFDPNATSGYIVVVTVSTEGAVTVTYPGGADKVSFVNEYFSATCLAHILVSANKFASGADLQCGRFAFGLFDTEGSLIETATNGIVDENESNNL